jgi:hypothetical protein
VMKIQNWMDRQTMGLCVLGLGASIGAAACMDIGAEADTTYDAPLEPEEIITGVDNLAQYDEASDADTAPGHMLSTSDDELTLWETDPATNQLVSRLVSNPWSAALPGKERVARSDDSFDENPEHFVAAVLYKGYDLGGGSLKLFVSNRNSSGNFSRFPSGWDKQASSFFLKDGCTLTLYEHVNRQGKSTTWTAGTVPFFSTRIGDNNSHSSARIVCSNNTDAGAMVFTRQNYRGAALVMWGGERGVRYSLDRPEFSRWSNPGSMAVNHVDAPSSSRAYLVELRSLLGGEINDGGLYRALNDALGTSLPSDLISLIMRFVPTCAPRHYCFRGDACDGIRGPTASSYRQCERLNLGYRSYCDALGRCTRANHEYVIPR